MLRFLRRIRQRLLYEGKLKNYLSYAIGEIVLVVLGILIALQINNWNEEQKKLKLKDRYLESLLTDLKKDSLRLSANIEFINKDLRKHAGLAERLSAPETTIDTLLQIVKYEFDPFIDPSSELSRNAITAIMSTGKIDLFEQGLRRAILQHNTLQQARITVMEESVRAYEGKNIDFPRIVKGPLAERMWKRMDKDDLLRSFVVLLESKIFMQNALLYQKQQLLEETTALLKLISF